MKQTSVLRFKVASEDWEFEQIHRLNYRTFVEEIPQHEPNPNGRLVDKFHADNTYMICLRNGQLLAMAAIRGERPFSLDEKLVNLDAYLPQANSICEIRLLAVENSHRSGRILQGLLELLMEYYETHGHDPRSYFGGGRADQTLQTYWICAVRTTSRYSQSQISTNVPEPTRG